MPELAVQPVTSPERAREIQRRLRNPLNPARDCGINLSKQTFAVKGCDDSVFFKPKPTPDARLLDRLKAERMQIVPLDTVKITASIRGHFPFDVPVGDPVLLRIPTFDEITHTVCEFFKVRRSELVSPRRDLLVVRPRQIAMWLAKKTTTRSLPAIGRYFGGRDHTTVLSAVRKVDSLMLQNEGFKASVFAVAGALRAKGLDVDVGPQG